jgi:hypothetical protein
VVYFREINKEKRKTTIQMTVNVERIQLGYSSRVSLKNKFEILIRDYEKKIYNNMVQNGIN